MSVEEAKGTEKDLKLCKLVGETTMNSAINVKIGLIHIKLAWEICHKLYKNIYKCMYISIYAYDCLLYYHYYYDYLI